MWSYLFSLQSVRWLWFLLSFSTEHCLSFVCDFVYDLLGSLYLMHQVTELLNNAMTQVYNLHSHLSGNLYSQESSMVFPSDCLISASFLCICCTPVMYETVSYQVIKYHQPGCLTLCHASIYLPSSSHVKLVAASHQHGDQFMFIPSSLARGPAGRQMSRSTCTHCQ